MCIIFNTFACRDFMLFTEKSLRLLLRKIMYFWIWVKEMKKCQILENLKVDSMRWNLSKDFVLHALKFIVPFNTL